jgi:hypothetical protein
LRVIAAMAADDLNLSDDAVEGVVWAGFWLLTFMRPTGAVNGLEQRGPALETLSLRRQMTPWTRTQR